MKKKYYLIGGIFFLGCFSLWTYLYWNGNLEGFDQNVRTFFEAIGNPFLYQSATILSFFASASFLIPLTIVLLFFFKTNKARIYLVSNLAYSTVLAHLFKIWIQRPRAVPFFGTIPKDFSYPSGHTMATLCFYGFLFLLFRKRVSKQPLRFLGQCFFLLLFFLIPISRLVLGIHYFSDVVASVFLSFFFLNLFFYFAKEIDTVFKI